ncbi:alpha/beta fold hydrolase [Lapillicoccus jejuensis]|uniref:Pimeloyl-ACP methyl ester carboxylesterase n=1 Tax=Lapillicoccus jejuensis TaxID=402171 RepID=A0A542E484_9MICO|nr:alpha/beta hydrolase [Lapillicoccus jejuensis]TQJ10127.1 pimeloyl-ACP methyl ester carboxylesterase [Lapillicoccus jejuensis]
MSTTSRVTGANGVQLHVEDSGGDGRPVVLVHGWPLSGASWEKQVPALTGAGLRVVTYDRRGFGRSDKPADGYDYDTFAADLKGVVDGLGLTDVSLVGFSMGGGEVARYVGTYGESGVHSVAFVAAVPPYLLKGGDNPDGALDEAAVQGMKDGLAADRDGFFPQFTRDFFSVDGELEVSEADVDAAVALAQQSDQQAALACITAFGTTDFRADLEKITVPTLVVHGDGDAIVPAEASGKRTAATVPGAQLHLVEGGPHGLTHSHPDELNQALVTFLTR